MLRDQADKYTKWLMDGAFASLGSYSNTVGLYAPFNGTNSRVAVVSNWQLTYLAIPVAQHYAMTGDANALAFCEKMATLYRHILDTFGGWNIPAYHWHSCLGYGIGDDSGTGPITADAQFAGTLPGGSSVSWPGGGGLAFSVPTGSVGWTLTDGDIIILDNSGGNVLPAGGSYTADQILYARDVSGSNCNFAATLGGAALPAPTGSGTQTTGISRNGDGGPWCMPASTAANSRGTTSADSYPAQARMLMCILKALAISPDTQTVIDDIDARCDASGGIDWTTTQQWTAQNSY
jgi:hypothetical protein